MRDQNTLLKYNPARIVANVFGILASFGGLTHGIGEVLQGNIAPDGIVMNSWTQGPIASNMGGEPAMTIVPNLLATGVLTILVSLAVLVWSIGFVHRKFGGQVLIALSIIMLLVGGGFGPPIIGILAGLAGTRINASPYGWQRRLPVNGRKFLAKLWPWVFGIAAISGTLLVVGSVILVYFFGVDNPDLFLNFFYLTVLSLLLSVLLTPLALVQQTERGMLA